jgi:anti-sigma factor RsiW
MRSFQSRNWACDRARQAVSVSLDAELSQLERVLLESHLDRCPACAAFAADAAALSLELRAAPLVRLERPVELPTHRRVGYSVRRTGAWLAGASVAATAVLVVLTLPTQRPEPSFTPTTSHTRANQDLRDLRTLRIAQMKPPSLTLSRRLRGPQLET